MPATNSATVLSHSRFSVELADNVNAVEETQRLRYQVFVEEMGARVDGAEDGIEHDVFDEYCEHLLVRDQLTGEVVASTRILTDAGATRAGGFYSASEFEIGSIASLPGSIMEVGRTCVHRDYRNGATIGALWQGLGEFITSNNYDYVIGCASISMHDGGGEAAAIMAYLRERYLSAEHLRVRPKVSLPAVDCCAERRLPPLLKAYLSLGARICGEAYWDRDFGVADVFVLFDIRNLSPRYARHFLTAGRRPQLRIAA